MSTLSLTSRTVLAVALAAGLSASFSTAAQADPSPSSSAASSSAASSSSSVKADAELAANYRLDFPTPGIQTGDPLTLRESGLTAPAATRLISWGDGSIETRTTYDPDQDRSHAYKKAGTFHVSVHLQSGDQTGIGIFPDGDAVTVYADAPADRLSGNFFVAPDHVKVNQAVQLSQSDIVGDDAPPVYVFRYVNWGDGSKEDEYSGAIPPPSHKYAKPGTYHVSVRMTNLQWHTAGKFPKGNTVVVTKTGGPGTGSGAGNGGAGGNGGADGGGLAITGPNTALLGGAGLILILGGAAAFLLLRRRTRFVG